MKRNEQLDILIRKCGSADIETAIDSQNVLAKAAKVPMEATALQHITEYSQDTLKEYASTVGNYRTEVKTVKGDCPLKYLRDARWDIVARLLEIITANVTKKCSDSDGYLDFIIVPNKEGYHCGRFEIVVHIELVYFDGKKQD